MSLESWKAEFYPVPADKVDKKDAVAHSLRKWIGLRKENLARHTYDDWISNFHVGGSTCALCEHYYGEAEEFDTCLSEAKCTTCPLALHLGGTCDDDDGPWWAWIDDLNPEPMIKALEETLAGEDRK